MAPGQSRHHHIIAARLAHSLGPVSQRQLAMRRHNSRATRPPPRQETPQQSNHDDEEEDAASDTDNDFIGDMSYQQDSFSTAGFDNDLQKNKSPSPEPQPLDLEEITELAPRTTVAPQESSEDDLIDEEEAFLEEAIQHIALPEEDFLEAILDADVESMPIIDTPWERDSMPPPPRRPSTVPTLSEEDDSEPVSHARTEENIDPLLFALGIWCERNSISRSQYSSLLEVLNLVKDVTVFETLPKTIEALNKRAVSHLPLLAQRRKEISVIAEKLPTISLHRNTVCAPACFSILRVINQSNIWGGQCDAEHIGRVSCVGNDFSSKATEKGAVTLQIAAYNDTSKLPAQFASAVAALKTHFTPREMVSAEDRLHYILKKDLIHHIPQFTVNYTFETGITNCSISKVFLPESQIRRVVNFERGEITPACQSHPPRGELELQVYGRQHFQLHAGNTISLQFLTFIDSFGLYRNMYRSLLGVYIILASLNLRQRSRRVNIFPLTLGSHASKFDDALSSIAGIAELDKGAELTINNEKKWVVAFTHGFLGDMPQQNRNSDFLEQDAEKGCRCCVCPKAEKADLDFDVIKKGRYHHHTFLLRQHASTLNKTQQKSPLHHLKSWRMQELERKHVDPNFLRATRSEFREEIASLHLDTLETVTYAFAAIAKSTAAVMAPAMTIEDRRGMMNFIKLRRKLYQKLCRAATAAGQESPSPIPSQLSDSTEVATPGAELFDNEFEELGEDLAPQSIAKKSTTFLRWIAQPNVHQGLHIHSLASEYATAFNCNVLQGEDQHRIYKSWATSLNGRSVEKVLLYRENIQQTIRLCLNDASETSDNLATEMVRKLAASYPTLVASLLPVSRDEDMEEESVLELKSDTLDRKHVASKYVQRSFVSFVLRLPILPRDITYDGQFGIKLIKAYRDDYDIPFVTGFGKSLLQWFQRFSWSDPVTEHRSTLNVGNFFQIIGGDVVRFDPGFLHETRPGERRLLAIVTEVEMSQQKDVITSLETFQLLGSQRIVGLPRIGSKPLYIISLSAEQRNQPLERGNREWFEEGTERIEGGELLFCDWEIGFM
ncbi:hypothetical protein V8E51_003085 [Hyaloscypha variabilis]